MGSDLDHNVQTTNPPGNFYSSGRPTHIKLHDGFGLTFPA